MATYTCQDQESKLEYRLNHQEQHLEDIERTIELVRTNPLAVRRLQAQAIAAEWRIRKLRAMVGR